MGFTFCIDKQYSLWFSENSYHNGTVFSFFVCFLPLVTVVYSYEISFKILRITLESLQTSFLKGFCSKVNSRCNNFAENCFISNCSCKILKMIPTTYLPFQQSCGLVRWSLEMILRIGSIISEFDSFLGYSLQNSIV